MVMIAPGSFVISQDMTEFEFDIQCEWAAGCDSAAAVMSQGCADNRPFAICWRHLFALQYWFESNKLETCICGRPLIYFDTHFDVMGF